MNSFIAGATGCIGQHLADTGQTILIIGALSLKTGFSIGWVWWQFIILSQML